MGYIPEMASTVQSFSTPGVLRNYGPDSVTGENMIAAGATVDTPLEMHMAPTPGETIDRLELQGPGAVMTCWIKGADLLIVTRGSEQRSSVVLYQNKTYEVQTLAPWFDGVAGAPGYQAAIVQEVVR